MIIQKLKQNKKLFFVLNTFVICVPLLQGASSDEASRRNGLLHTGSLFVAGGALTGTALVGASFLEERLKLSSFFSKVPVSADVLRVAGAVTLVSTGVCGAYYWNSWRQRESKGLWIEHFKSDLARDLIPSHDWNWNYSRYSVSDVQPYCSGYERPLPPHINAIAREATRYMLLPSEHYPFMYLTSRSRAHASTTEFNKIGIPDKDLEELYVPGDPQVFFKGHYLAGVQAERFQKLHCFFRTLFHELTHIKYQHGAKVVDKIEGLGQELEAELWAVGILNIAMAPTVLDFKVKEDDEHPTDYEIRSYVSMLLLKLSDDGSGESRAKILREKFSKSVSPADESMLIELNSVLHEEVSYFVHAYKYRKRYGEPAYGLSGWSISSSSSSSGSLSNGASTTEWKLEFQECPLYRATQNADIELVDQLLADGGDRFDVQGANGNAFHAALGISCKDYSKTKAMVDRLIAAKIDVNAKNVTDETPLHLIVHNRNISADDARYTIRRLLEAGAKWNDKNMFGKTPIEAAIYYGLPDRAEAIREFVKELSPSYTIEQ